MLVPGMDRHVHEVQQDLEKRGVEHITGVAIKAKTVVYQLHWPCRHCHVMHMLYQCLPHLQIREREHVQGFVTDEGRFLTREEAADMARANGQTVSTRSSLFSEELW